jgi:hypothetical protein
MDRELATAVLQRWEEGLPVTEGNLYKAASVLGIDPGQALLEARYYTQLDKYLEKRGSMTPAQRQLFSAAAGMDSRVMVKTASWSGFSPEELIIEALRENDFAPDLEKLANLSAAGGDPTVAAGPGAAGQGGPVDPAAMGGQDPQKPQPGAAVQQNPAARFKPSPTAPDQAAPSPAGNLDALLAETQGVYGQQAQDNGGLPPSGQPQPPPPPPDPTERVRQVAPALDDETAGRYADALTRLEEQVGMPVQDPKQMVKFVKEMQKVDGKRIDQGIKAVGEQLEQEQAAELGVGNQTFAPGLGPEAMNGGAAGGPPGAGGPGGGAKPPQAGPQGPAAQEQPNEEGPPPGGPQSAAGQAQGMPPKQKQQPKPAPQQTPQAAAEKVAHAARHMARCRNQ